MNERTEQRFVDKSGWKDGPWMEEPDRVTFEHAGFPIILKRHPTLGHWCGYVGVPEGHPAFGATNEYGDGVPQDVHGGCTYARACDNDPVLGVCHVKKDGEPERFWLGFDFAHGGDLSPGGDVAMRFSLREGGTYKNLRYVEAEAKRYAEACVAQVAQSNEGGA